jgi:hypothetical protein
MSTCLNTVKQCKACKQSKPLDAFYSEPRVSDGRTARCKTCIKSAASIHYDINKGDVLKRRKAEYSPEKERAKKLKSTYGISVELYDHMLKEQGYKCKLCPSTDPRHNSGRFVVDHCHTTGKVRGLLCSECNLMLGKAKDDITILQNAITYLSQHSEASQREAQRDPS